MFPATSVAVIVNVWSPSLSLFAVVSVPFEPRGNVCLQVPSLPTVTFQLELPFKLSVITTEASSFVSLAVPL